MKKFYCKPWLMWLFPVLFFMFQFILRLWPGLMMPQIMAQFSVDASHFGIIAACYYYGYAVMQIPVALLLLKFKTRDVIFYFAMVCGLATLLFTYCHNWYIACFARFLIGAGSAVGFLSVSSVVADWFDKTQYTKMISYSFTLGLLGAIYGGKPISLLVQYYHWQQVALVLALIAIVIGCTAYLFLRENPDHLVQASQGHQKEQFNLASLNVILRSPTLWVLALSNFLMVGALEGFSDVWGVPYLMIAYNITKSSAAQLISFVFVGMLFGGPLLAWLSKKWSNYPVIMFCGCGMTLAFIALLLTSTYHAFFLGLLFFIVGVLCCYQVIVFASGAALIEARYLGVTIAFLNCINMLGGSFFHTVIGQLMDFFWQGNRFSNSVRHYDLTSYHGAMMVVPICALIGAIMVGIIHIITYCSQNKNSKTSA